MMCKIDVWVFNVVCMDVVSWFDQVVVFVVVLRVEFEDDNFFVYFVCCFDRFGFFLQWLMVEFFENVIVLGMDRVWECFV